MELTKKELLHQLAEEAAYSFKGHMKTADWTGVAIAVYIFVPMITSLLILIFDLPLFGQRVASLIGFLFAAFALNSALASNRNEAERSVEQHMELGNKYLNLYNEIKVLATEIDKVDQARLSQLQQRIGGLNAETSKLRVGFAGRCWSRLTINKEMDLRWLYKTSHEDKPKGGG